MKQDLLLKKPAVQQQPILRITLVWALPACRFSVVVMFIVVIMRVFSILMCLVPLII